MTGSSTFTGNQNNGGAPQFKKEAFDLSAIKARISKMDDEANVASGGCCDHDHDGHGHGHGHQQDNLPLPVLKRLYALEHLQEKRAHLEAQFRVEVMELERKYLALYEPLYQERTKIVLGQREPTPEELADFDSNVEEIKEDEATPTPGIPDFWLTVLKNHPQLATLITPADQEALRALKDIRVAALEAGTPGFRLEFAFGPNDHFSNEILTKEYILENQVSAECDDLVYDHAVGTDIKWKTGKNLCFRTVTKVQRHRSNNSTRTITRREPTDSFFHFFYPPEVPASHDQGDGEQEEEEDVDADELDSQVQMDYELGDLIKSRIVPLAVDWFTGKALIYDEYYGEEDEEDYYNDEDEDDYDGSSDESSDN